jgi:hypothetical protein
MASDQSASQPPAGEMREPPAPEGGGWQTAAALAGVISVLLVVVSAGLESGLPRGGASGQAIANYYAQKSHWHRIEAGVLAGALSMVFFLWFLGALRQRLRVAEGGAARVTSVAFAAGVVFVALFGVLDATRGVIGVGLDVYKPFRNGLLDPQLVRVIAVLGAVVYIHALVVGSVLIGATSAITLRTGALPGWLGWLGAVIAVLVLVGSFVVAGVAVYLLLVWVLTFSLVLAIGPKAQAPADGT